MILSCSLARAVLVVSELSSHFCSPLCSIVLSLPNVFRDTSPALLPIAIYRYSLFSLFLFALLCSNHDNDDASRRPIGTYCSSPPVIL